MSVHCTNGCLAPHKRASGRCRNMLLYIFIYFPKNIKVTATWFGIVDSLFQHSKQDWLCHGISIYAGDSM